VARNGVELTRLQRYLLAAATFHPDRDRWRDRLYWRGRLALRLRSRNSRRVLAGIQKPFDLVVQNFGLFHTRGAPYVIYIDNTAHLSRSHWPRWVAVEGRALERLYAWERSLYREALFAFTQGGPAAQDLVDFYGVAPERVRAVGGGPTFESLPPRRESERDPVVLFVGGDWERKGGDVLLEAFATVRQRLPEARLQIVGPSLPRSEPGVEALGFVSDKARLADLYSRAGVYCLPSRFEPWGLSVSDAMAHELPCVVTRVGGLPDAVLDGETGLVVAPEDPEALAAALLRLLEDKSFATRLGRNGRSRIEHHQNWDGVVERMQPGLEQAAGRRGGRFQRRVRERVSR
jgi:glycosyltransferase involved in cell wall biosynthesis